MSQFNIILDVVLFLSGIYDIWLGFKILATVDLSDEYWDLIGGLSAGISIIAVGLITAYVPFI